jgi:enoyl-CoA hydratase/carnithine racemase
MTDAVLCTLADGVATVTLNRPDKRNALNHAVLAGLRAHFDALEANREVRVVVVRAAGPAFCSGMDLDDLSQRQTQGGDPEQPVIDALQQIERSRHPTIAMVHGPAYAGGCELALHCDFRIAADVARFAMPLARLGVMLPFPLAHKMVETVGPVHARAILLDGRPVEARRAFEIGMVHQVVPAAELEAATADLARWIAGHAPLALAGLKAMIIRATPRCDVDHADLDRMLNQVRQSVDAREGVRAMLEKRPPAFRGE